MRTEIKLNEDQVKLKNELDQISKSLNANKKAKSIYIYGEPGRGKSMLTMDFFHNLNTKSKIHLHFNQFMINVHKALSQIRSRPKQNQSFLEKFSFGKNSKQDDITRAVNSILKGYNVIFLDEFQVTDIADAMLLRGIFDYLFRTGVFIIFTSNSHPTELYKDGLKREVFLEFVRESLIPNCRIAELSGAHDYRALKVADSIGDRYLITNEETHKSVTYAISQILDGEPFNETYLDVMGREIVVQNSFEKIAVFCFDEIFEKNFGALDYNAIAQHFDLIFLFGLRKIKHDEREISRRLILFLDEVYEKKSALVIISDNMIDEIFETDSIHTQRAKSRLREIRSDEYYKHSKAANL